MEVEDGKLTVDEGDKNAKFSIIAYFKDEVVWTASGLDIATALAVTEETTESGTILAVKQQDAATVRFTRIQVDQVDLITMPKFEVVA